MISPRESFDFYAIFDAHTAQFESSATFAEFCDAIGAAHLKTYTWAPAVFATAKAGKRTWRALAFPTVEKFSDLFESAVFIECSSYSGNRPTIPQGYKFLAGDASLCMNVGGTRGWSKNHADIRSHYGAKFFGTYVRPRTDVYNVPMTLAPHAAAYEAIRRTDGILILAHDGHHIGSEYLALLPLSENIESLFDAQTQAFIASERQADIDAWGE